MIGLVLVLGIVFGVATFGLINIPGISPIKYGKAQVASVNPMRGYLSLFAVPMQTLEQRAKLLEATLKPTSSPVETKTPKPQPDLGDLKLAELWNSLEPAKLAAITEKWTPANLARILIKMDPDQVTEYLSTLKTERAVQLSKAIQQAASLPQPLNSSA